MARPSIVVCGGGIGGLAFAAAARQRGASVVLLERNSHIVRQPNFGSGIGLWPTSLHALAGLSPGLLRELESSGRNMPAPAYVDGRGRVLAGPSSHFSSRFPVLCLRREHLLAALRHQCEEDGVDMRCGEAIVDVIRSSGTSSPLTVKCASGGRFEADLVVGADGLHSQARAVLAAAVRSVTPGGAVASPRLPPEPTHCGYVYFRANVSIDDAAWHAGAFECWRDGARFGVVPLRHPELFWFASIPVSLRAWPAAAATIAAGTGLADASDLARLSEKLGDWSAPGGLCISGLLAATPAATILRTDIYKLPAVTRFPWSAMDGRLVLLGDACHATAPNVAQGAGLAIEDAVDLATLMLPHEGGQPCTQQSFCAPGVRHAAAVSYEAVRKRRAAIVQLTADAIARAGHVRGILAHARDAALLTVRRLAPRASEFVFERTVALALGSLSRQRLHWLPPQRPPVLASGDPDLSAPLALVGGWRLFRSLPVRVQRFRSDSVLSALSGGGRVTVDPSGAWWRHLLGLPPTMSDAPFDASVRPHSSRAGASSAAAVQVWTRGFGSGQLRAEYTTTHKVIPCLAADVPTGWVLLESVGGPFDRMFAFGYAVQPFPSLQQQPLSLKIAASLDLEPPIIADRGSEAAQLHDPCTGPGVVFESCGVWLFGRMRLPLPALLLPKASDESVRASFTLRHALLRRHRAYGWSSLLRQAGHLSAESACQAFLEAGR